VDQTGHQSNRSHRTQREEVRRAAYILIDRLSVTDREALHGYPDAVPAAVQREGGRSVLPHETETEALEGTWQPRCIVLIECEDAEQARRWRASPEDAPAGALHHQATSSQVILGPGSSG
jgi:uncharacterized protein (DUF1330 family)